jgi:hypothetical protein
MTNISRGGFYRLGLPYLDSATGLENPAENLADMFL